MPIVSTRAIGIVLSALLVGSVGLAAAARGTFDTASVRGRYTGSLTLTQNFSDGTTDFRVEARQLLVLTFDGDAAVSGASSATVAVPGQNTFTCAYRATGVYEIGDEGLGTATLDLVPASDVCPGGVVLKLSLLVGGHNRSRLDVTIDGATTIPDGQQLPIVGAGVLVK
jgi:hypothetical protein